MTAGLNLFLFAPTCDCFSLYSAKKVLWSFCSLFHVENMTKLFPIPDNKKGLKVSSKKFLP